MVPYLRAANVKDGQLDLTDVKTMDFNPSEQRTFSLMPGDVLVSEGSGSLGTVGASAVWNAEIDGVVCFQNTLLRLRPKPGNDPRFLMWWARHAYGSGLFASIADGANIYHLGADGVRTLPAAMPDARMQRAISDYLDAETARIDRLVTSTKAMIDLLMARRSSEVNRAVLPPSLPEDWEARRLRRIATLKSGDSITAESIEAQGDYPVYGGNGVRGYTSAYNCEGIYPLVGRQGALCGNVNYAIGRSWASEHAIVVRPNAGVEPYWLGELLRAMDLNQYSMTAAQPGLAVDQLENLQVPVPPLVQQPAISAWLRSRAISYESVSLSLNHRLGLLLERRQALITAAVTGQIEIPGVAA